MNKNRRSYIRILMQLVALLSPILLITDVIAASNLRAGQSLGKGQILASPNGKFQLTLQENGNLVITSNINQTIWNTNTVGTDADKLVMQTDGNLVLYSTASIPKWHTSTYNYSNLGIYASLENNGDLVLYSSGGRPVWDSMGYAQDGHFVKGYTQAMLAVPYGRAASVKRSISRKTFFAGVRSNFGRLNQSQVDGINLLLANMEKDTRPAINSRTVWLRQIAYLFSTVKHEVANTYKPITEYGNINCRRYDGGCLYKGRGYVQLTHRYNYRKMSPIVGVNLVTTPARALEPKIAYTVMSYGMFYGIFTGKKLGTYIRSGLTDYINARRVVNGTDRASLLAGYAKTFQKILARAAS